MSEKHPLRSQAAAWYNATWDLMEKVDRTPAETLDMLALAQASFTAWLAVPDHTATHESIGAWLVSRVHVLAGEARLAERWAHRSLDAAADPSVDGFYRAYAREALARAYRLQGRPEEVLGQVKLARKDLESSAEDETATLLSDLDELEASPGSSRRYSMSVHHPKPQFRQTVLDSMHRYGAAARQQDGLVEVKTLAASDGKTLLGFAIWESTAAVTAAEPALRAAVVGDRFDEWEDGPMFGWFSEPV